MFGQIHSYACTEWNTVTPGRKLLLEGYEPNGWFTLFRRHGRSNLLVFRDITKSSLKRLQLQKDYAFEVNSSSSRIRAGASAYMYACLYVCLCVCVCVCVYIYVYIYTHTYIYIHTLQTKLFQQNSDFLKNKLKVTLQTWAMT